MPLENDLELGVNRHQVFLGSVVIDLGEAVRKREVLRKKITEPFGPRASPAEAASILGNDFSFEIAKKDVAVLDVTDIEDIYHWRK